MGVSAPSFTQIHPSYMMPEAVMPYTQLSGAYETLPDGKILTRLSEGDLAVYINRVDVRTKVLANQSAVNQLPSCEVILSQISTPSYLQRVRADYDHHDTAAMARRGLSIVEAQRLAMRQGHFQLMRNALLYGYNPVAGEGLINGLGVYAVNLPADSYGNATVLTYDNGQMAFFLLQQILGVKVRTNNLGIGHKFTFLGPQRVLGLWEYNVVQLIQFQRVGAGTAGTAGTIKDIAETNGDEILWCYDDTLIGKGANGTDAVLLVMPEVANPQGQMINTNEFANLKPGLAATVLQLCDMPAPREIPVPIAGGAIDVLSELRVTSGWPIRPEAVTVMSMQYQ
jgi:hypothetical protein